MKIAFDDVYERLLGDPGTVFLLGAVDTGKTTFAAELLRRAVGAGIPAALVDADIAQATVGPPTTVGLKILRDGATEPEALRAADALADEGINARVIDCYSVKPIDAETLQAAGDRIVTVEDHWPEGGLGEAVLSAFSDAEERPRVLQLAVRDMPRSGKPAELLSAAGIDAEHIADAARRLVGAGAYTAVER